MKPRIILGFLIVLVLSACNYTFETGIEHYIDGAATVFISQQADDIATNIAETPTLPQNAIPTRIEVTRDKNFPALAVFMREGEIYLKDFGTNQETRISRTTKVGSPNLSPSGKYVIYFSLTYAEGFPLGGVFIADTEGKSEKQLGSTNKLFSKTTWSTDGSYLGIILFSSNLSAEALLFDATGQKEIARSMINLDQDLYFEQYDINIDCTKLEAKYITFCNEFTLIAKTKQSTPDLSYKADRYRNSIYTKPGYELIKSCKINDDLVVLEYYTGEPRNPESKWGIGGGKFYPGYDEGVTQTYTVILNEKTDKVVVEIPNAVDTTFLFNSPDW